MKSILWILSIAFATASSAQNRPTVSVTISQPTVTEGQGGSGLLVVRRSQGTATSLRVFYRVSGNARNSVDYERLSGSVDILAGSNEAFIEIIALDDSRREPTERVTVQLRPAPRNNPQYRLGARRTQTIRILDDEQPTGPGPLPNPGRPPTWFPLPGIITNPNPTNTTTTPTP